MKQSLKQRYHKLVVELTLKAQNSSCTDDERNIYYECAKQLHDLNFELLGE